MPKILKIVRHKYYRLISIYFLSPAVSVNSLRFALRRLISLAIR